MAGTDSLVRSSSSRSLRRIARAGRITRRAPRPCGERAALAQAKNRVGLGERPLDVVAHQHARAAGGAADQRLEPAGRVGVEVGARLVEQQQLGLVQHGPRHRQPLHHAARELAHRVVGAALHAHRLEQLVDPRRRHVVQARVVAQVLAPAQVAVEQRLVTEVAHPAGQLPALARELGAEHPRPPAVRAQQAGEHSQQRGLAGPVAAQHRERLARLHANADAGERDPLAVPPLKAVELDRRHAWSLCCRRWRGWSESTTWCSRSETSRRRSISTAACSTSSCAAAFAAMAFIDMGDQFLVLAEGRTQAAGRGAPLRARGGRPSRTCGSGWRRREPSCCARAASTSATRGATTCRSCSTPTCSSPRPPEVLSGMGLDGLEKSAAAQEELREKGLLG